MHHLRGALAHLGQPFDDVVAGLELSSELRQLRDRDALVADALEVDGVVQDREHEAQVGGHRRLLRKQLRDRLLDPVVAGVDLVVEGDDLVAELDVLRAEDVDGAAERPQDERALLLEGRLEPVEAAPGTRLVPRSSRTGR